MVKRKIQKRKVYSQKKVPYLPKELLFSRGLFVGTLFVLLLGIFFYKIGKGYLHPSSSPLPAQPTWQELQDNITTSPSAKTTDPLVTTVETFYTYIANQQFDLAYGLLSETFKNEVDYAQFAKGYTTTVKTTLVEAKRTDQMKNIVQVKIIASDTVKSASLTRQFIGDWQLAKEKGVWKLDVANIRQVE